jgi:hypothetical protein
MTAPPTCQEQSAALRKELMQELMGTPKIKRAYNKSPASLYKTGSKKAKFLQRIKEQKERDPGDIK